MFGIDHLISPHNAEEFIAEYWGQRALYIPGKAGKFSDLFGWDDVNHMLNFGRSSYDGFRLLYEKKPVAKSEFKNLEQWLEKGATLVVDSVNQVDPVMGKFASRLGYDMNTYVNINSYMSFPAKQGFDTHLDRHDVFVIQTAGQKKWVVFEPTTMWPLHIQKPGDGDPPDSDPYLECVMSPGDVLYIPRGHWHYALAETQSIHLTVGPEARSGANFLFWLVDRLMYKEEFLRKDFPIIRAEVLGGEYDGASFKAHMAKFREKLSEVFEEDQLTEMFMRYCMTTNRLRRSYQLPNAWAVEEATTLETGFVISPEQKAVVHYDDEDRTADVTVRGGSFKLEGIPRELLGEILNSRDTVIRGSGLLSHHPDGDWDQLKPWLVQMYKAGLLDLADQDSAEIRAAVNA